MKDPIKSNNFVEPAKNQQNQERTGTFFSEKSENQKSENSLVSVSLPVSVVPAGVCRASLHFHVVDSDPVCLRP
jgi:hypothetical protein